ncbi:MAG: hypothetical protein KME32_30120 [Mojavia pulchra JT2-VF2]|jgi:hypothetical protein|uniref:Uncharacterized protein n=1 Tax=Mojavia pulchra JT2-VF2 TaxID=287848 RepID=A0A951Q4C1_9NOST|nr:hypothetical protein [Mojavia pulchra JT2-VF2]
MIIADLNYLEVTTEEVLGGFSFSAEKDVDIDIDIDENIDINKNVDVTVDISGNIATAESGATAVGNNTLAESFAFTYTDGNTSSSNAFAVSATGN